MTQVYSIAQFSAGVEDVVGEVRSTFSCPPQLGYFADVDNDCKVFHVCHPVELPNGENSNESSPFIRQERVNIISPDNVA